MAICAAALAAALSLLSSPEASAAGLELAPLIEEAVHNSPAVLAADARARAAGRRVPQSSVRPDPMLMTAYQDEQNGKDNWGKSPDTQAMVGLTQTFPWPGKLGLKEDTAEAEAEASLAAANEARVKAAERVRELYIDLYSAERGLEAVTELEELFGRVEDAALARYSAGSGMQLEPLMAQKEKYVIKEREAMLREQAGTARAMLVQALGRGSSIPEVEGDPAEPPMAKLAADPGQYISEHLSHSPMVREREAMVHAAEARVRSAKRDYYPDITLDARYSFRGEPLNNMWRLTSTVNLPVYYGSKLNPAVDEALASTEGARAELEDTRQMLASTIRENVVMARSADTLMSLYKDSLIPRARQSFDSALEAYASGKGSASETINALRGVAESELQYWEQYAARQKAAIRLEASAGMTGMEQHGAGEGK